jgi:zinc transporter ZupT
MTTLALVGILTFTFTLLGGIFALKFKDKLHLILGFSAGSVIGVAFFDLFPEAIELAGDKYSVTTVIAIGFIVFMILDRFIFLHSHEEDNEHDKVHNKNGHFGAGSISIHSLLDGIAIGLAFQASASIGLIVAIGILAHNFSDGINTVNMILRAGGNRRQALKWVLIDAISPAIGITSTLFFVLPSTTLGLILALYAGFFLYIGASDLLPESHHNHPTIWTTVSTILGMSLIYIAITIAGI